MPRPIRKRTTTATATAQKTPTHDKVLKSRQATSSERKLGRRLLARDVSTIAEEDDNDDDDNNNEENENDDKENQQPPPSPKHKHKHQHKTPSPVKNHATATPSRVHDVSPSPAKVMYKPKFLQQADDDEDDDPFGMCKAAAPGRKLKSPSKSTRNARMQQLMDQVPVFDDNDDEGEDEDGRPEEVHTPEHQPTSPSKSALASPRKPLKPLSTEELLQRMPKASSSAAAASVQDEGSDDDEGSEPDDEDDLDYGSKRKKRSGASTGAAAGRKTKKTTSTKQKGVKKEGQEQQHESFLPQRRTRSAAKYSLEEEVISSD